MAKCDGTIASIKIDPQALNPADAQLLEDMILTAANQALGQAKEISNAEMGKVTAGLEPAGVWMIWRALLCQCPNLCAAQSAAIHTQMPMLPDSITALIAALGKLPGVGPRSAERIALHLVQTDSAAVKQLADAMLHARDTIRFCDVCGALTEKSPCPICADTRRDASLVCVVERAVDILSIEKSGAFRGKFHVLGGKISPLDGVEPEDLRIAELEKRLAHEPIQEVVIALGTDVEGDATSHYLAKRLARKGLKISRIAYGLPAGSGLEFADELTLSRALEGRREMS